MLSTEPQLQNPLDHGGVRISGQVEHEQRNRIHGRLAEVHKTRASASSVGDLIPEDSALSCKINSMIWKEPRPIIFCPP